MADTDAHEEITDLIAPLRRYVGAHLRSREDLDDVVQETLTRVIAAQPRLDPGVALAYSIVVARHVITDKATTEARTTANAHRLIDLTQPDLPEDLLVRVEERAALNAALEEIAPAQRTVFLAHVLDDEPVTAIAADTGVSSGSLAAQLARTRSRLRVEYLLALRGVDLPTDRCMPVLMALSGADTRRQRVLRAAHHLLNCPTCSSLSEPLLRRRSALTTILPWLGLGPLLGFLRRLIRNSPVQAAAATGALTLGTVALVAVAMHTSSPSPGVALPATSRPTVSARPQAALRPGQVVRVRDSRALLPVPANLASMTGQRVRGLAVPVLSVPADEGFWIGDTRRGRIWVQLTHAGAESPVKVRPHDTVTFTATVAIHGAGFARRTGVSAGEGAAILTGQGAHLSVDEQDLKVHNH